MPLLYVPTPPPRVRFRALKVLFYVPTPPGTPLFYVPTPPREGLLYVATPAAVLLATFPTFHSPLYGTFTSLRSWLSRAISEANAKEGNSVQRTSRILGLPPVPS